MALSFSLIESVSGGKTSPKAKEYYTHDNGGRPFIVTILKKGKKFDVNVYINPEYGSGNKTSGPICAFDASKIFIGKSPLNEMTKHSGGHGPRFDGNSILIKTGKNEYVHIGSSIFKFNSLDNITKYTSPVGNSDMPYPYSIDLKGRYYLMLEKFVIPQLKSGTDPYDHFYNIMASPKCKGTKKAKVCEIANKFEKFRGIVAIKGRI
jgi:hypothetical protein